MTIAPVRILRLAAGGAGVGKLEDGRTVFVPRTAPGDLVALTEIKAQKRFAWARLGQLIEAGPDRVAPKCAHYDRDRCGGCQLQHLSPAAQRAAKSAIVGDALRRIGRVELADPEVVPSEIEWDYRSKLTLTVAGTRIGLHQVGDATRVFELERCEIVAPALRELWDRLRPHRRLLPEDAERIVLRLDRTGGCHVIVETRGAVVWDEAGRLVRALGNHPMTAVWWRPEGGAARVMAGGAEAYPATVFEQIHPLLGDEIRRYAVAQAAPAADMHAWDLYAGIGETTELLLDAGATVESVEIDRRAVEQGQRQSRFGSAVGSQVPGGRVKRHAGRVEDLVARLRPPATVITNPPRIGMEERAVRAIVAARPRRVVYVSCDAATLARDVARFGPGWRITSVRAFDLFPQTAHVETVLVLE
ncbi:MAG: class I SAM-dependent RNA methyltransferase, partial [Gemmatimonadales bacterium]